MTEKRHETTAQKHDTTDQRGAAEVDVAFEKLVRDLHASRENPVEPKELLKRRKRAQRRRGENRTSLHGVAKPGRMVSPGTDG